MVEAAVMVRLVTGWGNCLAASSKVLCAPGWHKDELQTGIQKHCVASCLPGRCQLLLHLLC